MVLGPFGATLRWGCIWPILHLGNGELAHGDRIFAKGHVVVEPTLLCEIGRQGALLTPAFSLCRW